MDSEKMKKEFSKLPLRKGVGVVLLNNENKVFVAKRIDNPKNFWQMPQGGVDGGENYYEAALRELKEETSVASVELIQEIDKKLTYILPNHLIGIIWRGRFKGQTQKWFVMRFIGNESEININTKNPEFLDWKWIDLEDLTKIAVNFKLDVYKNLKQEVSKILN
jgi:putative (di)nucleoside polyphosphate hydrolase